MNLTQAKAIASLHTELMNSIDKTKIKQPEPTFRKSDPFSIDEMSLEDEQLVVRWARYDGEYEYVASYHSLESLFED